MNTIDAILNRRSTRNFTDQLIENEKLHQILEAAMSGQVVSMLGIGVLL